MGSFQNPKGSRQPVSPSDKKPLIFQIPPGAMGAGGSCKSTVYSSPPPPPGPKASVSEMIRRGGICFGVMKRR